MSGNDKPKVYLAGAVKETDDPHTWRDDATEFIAQGGHVEALDPLDKYDSTGDDLDTEDGDNLGVYDDGIIKGDLDMIVEADAIVAHHPEACETWGTPMELFFARMCEMPVALAWGSDTTVSSWGQVTAEYIVDDWRDTIMYIEDQLTEADPDYVESGTGVDLYNPRVDDGTETFDLATYVAENVATVDHDCVDESEVAAADGGSQALSDFSGDELAGTFLEDVAALVNNDRDTHGDAVENQEHIAEFWTTYLRGLGVLDDGDELTGGDVASMMGLLKMSRMVVGEYAHDHLRDIAGYASIGASCEFRRDNGDDEFLIDGDHE